MCVVFAIPHCSSEGCITLCLAFSYPSTLPPAICQTANCSGGMCVVSASNQRAVVCINCPVGQYGSQCQYSVRSTGPDPCVLNNYCNGHGVCSYTLDNGRIGAQCVCSSDYNSGAASCQTPTVNYCYDDKRCTNGTCDLDASIRAQKTVCVCTASKCSASSCVGVVGLD